MSRWVAAFTDTYLPTINGVTYTIRTWRDFWEKNGGRMDVVYPQSDDYAPEKGEHPIGSLPFPFYDGYRLGTPRVPKAVLDAEIVHSHTPFAIGLGGLRLARKNELPFVTSYHTPTGEYADYLVPNDSVADYVERAAGAYERWFFGRSDAVLTPSEATREHIVETVGVDAPVHVVPNGIDVERFHPVETAAFVRKYDLDVDRPLVGYTGRHGFEKRLSEIITAADGMDLTVVFGGDGPARESLEKQARDYDVDVRFLGFLDRDEMAAFYSALDVFAFPSPVETQGLVALEANACGTPVVGANAGALSNTIVDGETGYHFESGDIEDVRASIRRTLAERERLRESCLARRDEISVERAVEKLERVYDRVC
ncbi:glycosyltransferase [Haladaptatus paucihalophilus DX253]|uniref:Glycosyltransferase n=1 Tax=Haladaptatus paucihalophilus DX253 TaxID=797209 RepID=E7QYF1_HALPU|nr:glycosyltransferase [Haladaptatus paucihalophilus]EFW90217.1 glycosyltransferase [Haladaptatus paucihalophilus DX253]SHJ98373.1 Glycosyltransferase involved in cell wall bisynthesis [Haladaptatus paucihalophilus DX253]